MSFTAYKVGSSYPRGLVGPNEGLVLITLRIPGEARTNINRKNAIVPRYAAYRCDRALVLKVEYIHPHTLECYGYCPIGYNLNYCPYDDYAFEYPVGCEVFAENYEDRKERVSTRGIHFFLDRMTSIHYGLDYVYNGMRLLRHVDGTLYEKREYERENHIRTFTYYSDGSLESKQERQHGIMHGESVWYYPSGRKKKVATFYWASLKGIQQEWDALGLFRVETFGDQSCGTKSRIRMYQGEDLIVDQSWEVPVGILCRHERYLLQVQKQACLWELLRLCLVGRVKPLSVYRLKREKL